MSLQIFPPVFPVLALLSVLKGNILEQCTGKSSALRDCPGTHNTASLYVIVFSFYVVLQ